MKRKIVFIICAVFLFTAGLLISKSEALNLTIDEGKVRLSIPPGGTKTGVINIRNTSSDPIDIRAYLEDWYYLPIADGSKEFLPKGTSKISCAEWINFSPAEFTIPAYGKQVVNYTVRVPKDVKGGRYAVLFFETMISDPEMTGFGLGVAARMGSLFYIEPEGTIQRQVNVENLLIRRENAGFPLSIVLEVLNNGNVDITAAGTFHIIDRQGMVYARGEFEKIFTFPGDRGKLTAQWKQPLLAGKYDLIITLDLGKALEEAGMGRGPVITKEVEIDIGSSGEIARIGDLK